MPVGRSRTTSGLRVAAKCQSPRLAGFTVTIEGHDWEDVEEVELPELPREGDTIETRYGTCVVTRAELLSDGGQYAGKVVAVFPSSPNQTAVGVAEQGVNRGWAWRGVSGLAPEQPCYDRAEQFAGRAPAVVERCWCLIHAVRDFSLLEVLACSSRKRACGRAGDG